MADEKEVKPSWSWNYILLTLLISTLTGGIGYSFNYLFNKPPSRKFLIVESPPKNLVELSPQVDAEITAKFSLKKNPDIALKGFYQYSVTIKNIGSEGVENFPVVVDTGNDKIVLIKPPTIHTTPSHILPVSKPKSSPAVAETFKDEWEISLLNPEESITFEYIAYSAESLKDVKFLTVAGAKNLTVQYRKTDDDASQQLSQGPDLDDLITVMLIVVLLAAVATSSTAKIITTLTAKKKREP